MGAAKSSANPVERSARPSECSRTIAKVPRRCRSLSGRPEGASFAVAVIYMEEAFLGSSKGLTAESYHV
jgi:hypothetical protein